MDEFNGKNDKTREKKWESFNAFTLQTSMTGELDQGMFS
jgi:hypothetical protein